MDKRKTASLLAMCLITIGAMAQAEGKVVDEHGEPLVGATVRWEGTNVGTTTDINGKFRLAKNGHLHEIVTSMMGYHNDTTCTHSAKYLVIRMRESVTDLHETHVHGRKQTSLKMWHSAENSELITAALATVFGQKFAALFVAAALMMFAFSTVLGWSLYGTRCVEFLFGFKASKIYQIIFCGFACIAGAVSLDLAWAIADTLNGLMAIPNLIAVALLSPVVFKLTKEYFTKVKK